MIETNSSTGDDTCVNDDGRKLAVKAVNMICKVMRYNKIQGLVIAKIAVLKTDSNHNHKTRDKAAKLSTIEGDSFLL